MTILRILFGFKLASSFIILKASFIHYTENCFEKITTKIKPTYLSARWWHNSKEKYTSIKFSQLYTNKTNFRKLSSHLIIKISIQTEYFENSLLTDTFPPSSSLNANNERTVGAIVMYHITHFYLCFKEVEGQVWKITIGYPNDPNNNSEHVTMIRICRAEKKTVTLRWHCRQWRKSGQRWHVFWINKCEVYWISGRWINDLLERPSDGMIRVCVEWCGQMKDGVVEVVVCSEIISYKTKRVIIDVLELEFILWSTFEFKLSSRNGEYILSAQSNGSTVTIKHYSRILLIINII